MIKISAPTWDHMLVLSVPFPLITCFYFYASLSLVWAIFLTVGWLFFCFFQFPSFKLLLVQVSIICIFSILSQYEIQYEKQQKSQIAHLKQIEFTGVLYDLPKQTDTAYAFTIQTVLKGEKVLFRVLATRNLIEPTRNTIAGLSVGKEIKMKGELSHHTGTQNFYGFDAVQYERQLHRMGSIFLSEIPSVQSNQVNSIRSVILNFRTFLMEKINSNHQFPTANAYANALVFGERTGMNEEISTLYQKYGLVHLLAISGMQIHLFTFGLFGLLLRIGFTRERLYLFLLLLQPILFILTGGSTSVGRACMTTAFFLLFQLLFIRKDVSFPISMAFFLTIALNPDICLDIGFQLSFFLSACLLFSRNILARMRNMWMQIFMASLICQLTSIPILIFHFHIYAPLSLPLNLLFIPFINFFVFPLSLFIVVLSLLSFPFLSFLSVILEKGVVWSEKFLLSLSGFSEGMLIFPHPSVALFLIELITLMGLLTKVEQAGWKKSNWVVYVLLCVFVFHYISPKLDSRAQVSFLDVGQGDCTVIITPFQKEVILIDSGGVLPFRGEGKNQQMAEQIILHYLQAKGVHAITYYIATHGDLDHIGTLPYLQKSIPIEYLMIGEKISYTESELAAMQRQKENHKKVITLTLGDTWPIKSGEILCLNPSDATQEGNASSVVLCMTLYQRVFYFMGDAEKNEELALAKQYHLPVADFLKVGHHGSKTSSAQAFIKEIQPKYSVLSLGENNTYGHPHEETLQTLSRHGEGGTILRTDKQGQIVYVFRKDSGTIFYRAHMLTE